MLLHADLGPGKEAVPFVMVAVGGKYTLETDTHRPSG